MKKAKTQTKSRVATKSKISVRHKIALSLMMVSAFALGINFAVLSMQLPKPIKVKVVRVTGPIPLAVNITSTSVNLPVYYPDGVTATFTSSGTYLGNLDMNSNNFNPPSNYGDWGVNALGPLKLFLTHLEEGVITIPSRIIRIEEADINVYNLCVPETLVFNEDLDYAVSYYYDINGTPYTDVELTQMATPEPCNLLLANAYDPIAVTDAKVNLPVGVYPQEVYAEFHSNFTQYYESTHGTLNMTETHYENRISTHFSGAPLAVAVVNNTEGEPMTVSSKILKVSAYDVEKDLCLPETYMEGNFLQEPPIYFYDNNGSPYYDSLLTDMAIPAPCNQLLANRFETYNSINNVMVNYTDDELEYGSLLFNGNFGLNYSSGQGSLWLDSNNYEDYPPTVVRDHFEGAPMAISVLQDSANGSTLAARVLKLRMDDQTEHIICVPETYVPGGSDYPEIKIPVYFYDNNGTPYNDSLLIDMAIPAPCNQLLANKLDVGVSDVNLNLPVWNFVSATAGFMYNFGDYSMHRGNLNLKISDYDLFTESNQSGAPLAIELFHGEDTSATIPARILVLEALSGDYYTLCLPSSLIRSDERELYFYDTNGTPYKDSLMTDMAIPKACDQLLAKSLDIDSISNATIRETIASPDDAKIYFIHNGSPIGNLNANTNSFTGDPFGVDDLFTHPLTIFLLHGEDGDQRFPTMKIGVESGDRSYSLCVPSSMVVDYTNTEPVHYFYDLNGKPYLDSLLTQAISCPPIDIKYNFEESLLQ